MQGRKCPHVVDTVFDAFAEREGFVCACDDDDYLSRIEDSLHADGKCHARYGGDIVVEEA